VFDRATPAPGQQSEAFATEWYTAAKMAALTTAPSQLSRQAGAGMARAAGTSSTPVPGTAPSYQKALRAALIGGLMRPTMHSARAN